MNAYAMVGLALLGDLAFIGVVVVFRSYSNRYTRPERAATNGADEDTQREEMRR